MPNKTEQTFLKSKLKIAVTGGIGTGKSLVCRYFESQGYYVINADLIAKNLMANDEEVKEKLIKVFGENVFDKNGLNKKIISELIFNEEKNLQKINSIVHPATIKKINELAETELLLKDIVFVESALIFEAKREALYDYILLVTSPLEKRIERIMNRDKISKEEILSRINAQLSDDEKKKKSHFIIANDSSVEELQKKAKLFLGIFEKLIHESNLQSRLIHRS
ncbi:MAG: dephospho-CoA kinase [Ignavibacteriales bacterium CG_4_9_14_3_um_filter_34_10]|nr:MAG: dephospho-CoA kinase [Ignavibacteriales bacterium CG_4_9_14_3_um_filter_34_10]